MDDFLKKFTVDSFEFWTLVAKIKVSPWGWLFILYYIRHDSHATVQHKARQLTSPLFLCYSLTRALALEDISQLFIVKYITLSYSFRNCHPPDWFILPRVKHLKPCIVNNYMSDLAKAIPPQNYLTYIYLWNSGCLSTQMKSFFKKFPKVFKFLESFQ